MLNIRERQEKFGKITYDPSKDRFTLDVGVPMDSDFYESELSAPLTVHWLITMKCNARCDYCYEKDYLLHPDQEEDVLSREEIDKFLRDFSGSGGFRTYLTGGEPTLNPHLPFIVRQAESHGLKSVVNSNGIDFPEEVYDAVKDCNSRLSLSLDSHIKETHNQLRNQDSYDSIVTVLDKAKLDSLDVRIISVLQNTNQSYWQEFGKFLQEKGVGSWFIQPLVGMEVPGDLEESLSDLEMNIRILPAIFDSFFYIMPNGYVVPYAFQKRNSYGNVRVDSIKDIWEKVPKKTVRDYLGLLHLNSGRQEK